MTRTAVDIRSSPMNKISLIGIWMETVIYGFNCIVFGLCMFVLLRDGKAIPRHWVLILTSTLLFSLCTIHIAASLRQLLEAFAWGPAGVPNYSTLYWLDTTTPLSVLKEVLYDTLVFLQDIVLIWRFYIVFNRKWQYVVFIILVGATRLAVAYGATVIYTLNPSLDLYDSIISRLGLTGLALDIAINVSLTMAIAIRLWWMGRAVGSYITARPMENQYLATIYIVVESGGLFSGATIVMLGLYINNSPATLTALDIASQLAVLTPLLIVVRVGLGLTHGLQREYETATMFGTVSPGSKARNPCVHVSIVRETRHQVDLTSLAPASHTLANDMKV